MQATNVEATSEQRSEVRPGCENVRQFDDVLSRCLPAFQRRAFRHLGNTADAEDAVQDALLSAYKHLDQFKGGAQMSTWLTTIVINSARMQLRRRSRHLHLSLDEQIGDEQEYSLSERMADHGPSPEDECRESQLHEHVRQLLTQLSPQLRNAFVLRELDGLTTHEAAVILGVPDGTVKARLTRARAKISELIRPWLDAKATSAPPGSPLSVATMEAKRSRVTRRVRFCVQRAQPRRRVLRRQSPGNLVAGQLA